MKLLRPPRVFLGTSEPSRSTLVVFVPNSVWSTICSEPDDGAVMCSAVCSWSTIGHTNHGTPRPCRNGPMDSHADVSCDHTPMSGCGHWPPVLLCSAHCASVGARGPAASRATTAVVVAAPAAAAAQRPAPAPTDENLNQQSKHYEIPMQKLIEAAKKSSRVHECMYWPSCVCSRALAIASN